MFDLKAINILKETLHAKQETIAVAESVTAGLLQTALSSASEAMQIFQGGITVYNVGQKCRHLLIDPIHAVSCNCVSERVAREMALHVCGLFCSDWGIGITGYASPVPESENQLFSYYAISYKGEIKLSEKINATKGDDIEVKLFFVHEVIEKYKQLLQQENK